MEKKEKMTVKMQINYAKVNSATEKRADLKS